MSIQRWDYDYDLGLVPCEDGPYVTYDDHVAAYEDVKGRAYLAGVADMRTACMKAVVDAGHLKVPAYVGDDRCDYCDVSWPCATIEALERVQP